MSVWSAVVTFSGSSTVTPGSVEAPPTVSSGVFSVANGLRSSRACATAATGNGVQRALAAAPSVRVSGAGASLAAAHSTAPVLACTTNHASLTFTGAENRASYQPSPGTGVITAAASGLPEPGTPASSATSATCTSAAPLTRSASAIPWTSASAPGTIRRAALNVASTFRPSPPGASVACAGYARQGGNLPATPIDSDETCHEPLSPPTNGTTTSTGSSAASTTSVAGCAPQRASAAWSTSAATSSSARPARPLPPSAPRRGRRPRSSSAASPVISAEPDSAPGCVQNGGRPLTDARRFAGTVPVVIVQCEAKLPALSDPAPESWMNSFAVSSPVSRACVVAVPGPVVFAKSIPSHGSTSVISPLLMTRSSTETGRPKSTMNALPVDVGAEVEPPDA